MDYQDIIKLQEQSPIYSTGNHSFTLKQCMASFYDNDSEIQKKIQHHLQSNYDTGYGFQHVIDYLQKYVDIIDMPMEDIMMYIDRMEIAQGLDRGVLRKKILKRKNLLKRYRAKNRQPRIFFNLPEYEKMAQEKQAQTQTQIKKKRNRVSAQVSRDRKKQYFKELEEKNQQLQEQILKAKLENEQLKKSIEQQKPQTPKTNYFTQSLNNKLTRLLIFLGIICLIGMLKQTLLTAGEGYMNFKTPQKINQMNEFPSAEHFKMMEEGQKKVVEFLQEGEEYHQKQLNIQPQIKKVDSVSLLQLSDGNSGRRYKFFSSLMGKLENMRDEIYKKSF